MRTPPPTNKKREKNRRLAKKPEPPAPEAGDLQAMPSPEQQRTPRNPIFPTSAQDISPQLFSSFQFSPAGIDAFGYNSAIPTTAPTYPQDALFWEQRFQSGSLDTAGTSLLNQNALQLGPSSAMHWAEALGNTNALSQSYVGGEIIQQTPIEGTFLQSSIGAYDQNASSNQLSDVFATTEAAQPPVSSSSIIPTSGGVDPSLLFGPTTQTSIVKSPAVEVSDRQSIQSRRAKPLKISDSAVFQNGGHSRNSTETRPSAKRRATDTVVGSRTRFSVPLYGEQTLSSAKKLIAQAREKSVNSQGTSQRPQEAHLLSIIEDTMLDERTALTLTIDEHGRAHTERKSLSPSKSIAKRTRKLSNAQQSLHGSESDSTSSSDDDYGYIQSRNASFSSAFGKHSRSKHTSFADSITEQFRGNQSRESSRPGTASYGSSPSLPPPLPRGYHSRNGSGSVSFSETSTISPVAIGSDEDDEMGDAPTDAQTALRQIVAGRAQRRSTIRQPSSSNQAA
ncbi:MAG: hypothetical protein M1814_000403 [Vezdaea aestivalis]|nr:MAG: hypothetical protein M1814_000403 [Vezdaea aestivalis]